MSTELNYYRIAQILGGIVTETTTPSFGAFGAAQASVERLRLVTTAKETEAIPMDQSLQMKQVFESVRNGYELDRVLIDPNLSKQLMSEMHKAGINASWVAIARRLQSIRKDKKTYGVNFEKATRAAGLDPRPFFHAAELGFVQLGYRRDVNVDDIVTDPEVGKEYVSICKEIDPRGHAIDFKWTALRLRKMRYFNKKKRQKLLAIAPEEIQKSMVLIGSLDRISMNAIPVKGGVFWFTQRNRKPEHLYVGAGDSLRQSLLPFENAKPFRVVAGQLWQPLLSDIYLHARVVEKKKEQPSAQDLSLRLIDGVHPLFNMAVHITTVDEAENDEDPED
jgi:hypothetical protein